MSQSFFKYETQQEIMERIKRLRVKMLKDQLREARRIMEKQYDELNNTPGQAAEDKERSYSLTGELNSDVLGGGDDEGSLSGDELAGGVNDGTISGGMNVTAMDLFASGGEKRERFDLSGYLTADKKFEGEGAKKLKEILNRIDDRVPDSDKARKEYSRLMANVERITGDSSLDIEDVLRMAEQQVNIYIENRNYDNSALDEDLLYDYKALCILLGVDEQVISPTELKNKVDEMLDEYSRKSDNEVVAEMVNEALINLGMKVDGSCVLDSQMEGELYSSGDDDKCKVFVSCNSSGVMIEPVNASEDADTEEIMNAQKKVCAAEKNLMDEASKSGIILKKIYANEHSLETMATEKNLKFDESYMKADTEDKFEKMRSYNRMRRNRQRKEKAREMRYE